MFSVLFISAAAFMSRTGMALPTDRTDVNVLFAIAERDGRTGLAHKTKSVEVRPAQTGEIIVTKIAGVEETRSPPAQPGDMVVRNRCPETGNEEILVSATRFTERYEGPLGSSGDMVWQLYRPRGVEMLYFTVRDIDGPFTFIAPWGEPMVAHPGDVIVRDPQHPADTYRIAKAAFACTYEVLRTAPPF
jgi:hypothetical protein